MGEVEGDGAVNLFECQEREGLSDTLRRLSENKRIDDRVQRHTAASDRVTIIATFDIVAAHKIARPDLAPYQSRNASHEEVAQPAPAHGISDQSAPALPRAASRRRIGPAARRRELCRTPGRVD